MSLITLRPYAAARWTSPDPRRSAVSGAWVGLGLFYIPRRTRWCSGRWWAGQPAVRAVSKCSSAAVAFHMRLYVMCSMWRETASVLQALILLRHSCQKSWWHSVYCDSRSLHASGRCKVFLVFFSPVHAYLKCLPFTVIQLSSGTCRAQRRPPNAHKHADKSWQIKTPHSFKSSEKPVYRWSGVKTTGGWTEGGRKGRKKRGERWGRLRRWGDPGDAGCRGLFHYQPL